MKASRTFARPSSVALLSSTALNMIVVPILYERFGPPVVAPLADATQE
jgi:hypothetical protein